MNQISNNEKYEVYDDSYDINLIYDPKTNRIDIDEIETPNFADVKFAMKAVVESFEKKGIIIVHGGIVITRKQKNMAVNFTPGSLWKNLGHEVKFQEIINKNWNHSASWKEEAMTTVVDFFREQQMDITGGKIIVLRKEEVDTKICFCYSCQRMKGQCIDEKNSI